MSFDTLGLEPRLLAGVQALGYTDPTPIQEQAIPLVLAGRDLVGVAQTGTGKTAAFVLPLLQRTPTRQGIKALIVTPTRELALQISEVVYGASKRTGHKSTVVFGGVGIQPQIQKIRRGVDVLIACPGRLLDLHQRRVVDLSKVETLVLDEADRMLDMGFWPDVKRIIDLTPKNRQNLLFSATMDPQVIRIVESILTDPAHISVTPASTPVERIDQAVYPVARGQKTDLLVHMLNEGDHTRTIVFTRTKHRADRLAKQLSHAGVSSSAIHGGRSQAQRQTALEAFKRGRHKVIVATDVLSRGIDVNEVSHVVNYDMPNSGEDYVHRIGRTARAGATGSAISFCDETEHEVLRDIEKTLGSLLATQDAVGFDYDRRSVPDPERTIGPAPKQAQRKGDGRSSRRAGRRGGQGRASGSGNGSGSGSSGRSSSSTSGASSSGGSQQSAQPKRSDSSARKSTNGGRSNSHQGNAQGGSSQGSAQTGARSTQASGDNLGQPANARRRSRRGSRGQGGGQAA